MLAAALCYAALLLGGQGAKGTDTVLSPDYPAIRVEPLLKQLSKDSGLLLTARSPMKDQVVVLRAEGITLKEAMERLADVLNGTWEKTREGYQLIRDKKTAELLSQADIELRRKAIQEKLDVWERDIQSAKTPYEEARAAIADYERMGRGEMRPGPGGLMPIRNPADRLMKRLAIAIGADTLARLPYMKYAIFASEPTSAERPLPPSAAKAIASYTEQLEAIVQLADATKVLPDAWSSQWWKADVAKWRKLGGVGKIAVVAYWLAGELILGMRTYTRDGDYREAGVGRIALSDFPSPTGEGVKELPVAPNLIRIEGTTAELADFLLSNAYGEFYEFAKPKPGLASQALREALLHPEEYDPLAFWIEPALKGRRDEEAGRVIGVLPDALFKAASSSTKEDNLDAGKFWGLAESQYGLRKRSEKGWLILRQENPPTMERMRFSRPALGKLMRAAHAAKEQTLRDLCVAYAESDPGFMRNTVLLAWRYMLPTLVVRSDEFDLSSLERVFLGSIPNTLWAKLIKGEWLDAARLPAAAKAAFVQWTIWGSGRDSDDPTLAWKRTPEALRAGLPETMLMGAECMPLGPPPGTMIRLSIGSKEAVEFVGPDPGKPVYLPRYMVLNADTIVGNLFSRVEEKLVGSLEEAAAGEWRFGPCDEFTLEVRIPAGIAITRRIAGLCRFDESKPTVRWSGLPESFRAEVKKQWDELKKGGG